MKEKKSKTEEEKTQTFFYFETIGFISILLAVIVVAQLGKIGSLLTVFFKVLFGDWYLLSILIIFIFGGFNIISHKTFDFKNQRFLGYIICFLGLLMLTHFPVHKYVISEGNSYIKTTWQHYQSFISTKATTYLGGGIIGGTLFYIFYSLFGKIGVILISLILLVLGFTMIINKSLKEICAFVFCRFKNINKYRKNFSNFFKYEIGKKAVYKEFNIYDLKKEISINILDDYKNFGLLEFQEKHSKELKQIIISVLDNLSLQFKFINSIVSYSVTYFSFLIYDKFETEKILNKLINMIDEAIYIHRIDRTINIEINNKHVSILTLKNLLLNQSVIKTNYLIPIGMNIKNQIEEIDASRDSNILLIGDIESGIKTFIASFIVSLAIKISPQDFVFNLFDEKSTYSSFKKLFFSVKNNNLNEYLTNIINIIDERLIILNENKCNHIDEYNIKTELLKRNRIKRLYYVIEIDTDTSTHNYSYIEDKIMYIIQVGKDTGVYVFYILRDNKKVSSLLVSLFHHQLYFISTDSISNTDALGNHIHILSHPGDVIYRRDNEQHRMQTPLITIEEINNINKNKN